MILTFGATAVSSFAQRFGSLRWGRSMENGQNLGLKLLKAAKRRIRTLRNRVKGDRKPTQAEYTDRYKQGLGEPVFVENQDEIALISYKKNNSEELDFETYKEVQALENKRKIGNVFAKEINIKYLSDFLTQRSTLVKFGLCHGVRRGVEQAWFEKHIGGGVDVLGTEISETATRFPKTIEWDFHETKPEWIESCDFIYSNSWDHAMDPERAFSNWVMCLKSDGVLLLEHTKFHTPKHVSPADPFGVSCDGLVTFVNKIGSKAKIGFIVETVLRDLPYRERDDVAVVVRRLP
ncbi:MAG: hypothetical protein AAGM38_01820 [Pseudomonadota bacterium]